MSDEDEAERIVRGSRDRVLRGTRALDGDVDEILRRATDRLTRRARLARTDPAAWDREVADALNAAARALTRRVGSSITDATLEGVAVDATLAASVGAIDPPTGEPARVLTLAEARALANERLRTGIGVRPVPIGGRFFGLAVDTRARLTRTVERSIRAGESVIRTAERILGATPPRVELPRYVEELVQAADTGDLDLFLDEVNRWQAQIARLGEGANAAAGQFTIRSATQDLVDRMARKVARGEDVRAAVDRWIYNRARFHARMIARTETVEAWRSAYVQTTQERPWVVGYTWKLGTGHPRPDVCDLLANQDLHGLGPGGYPPNELPGTPHPLDACYQVAIIDRDYLRRQAARLGGEREPARAWESGRRVMASEWLADRSPEFRERILGPTRARVFDVRPSAAVNDDGSIPKLAEVAARLPARLVAQLRVSVPPPRAPARTVVPSEPLVAEERASFVRPFPSFRAQAAEGVFRESLFRAGRRRAG